MAAVGWLAITSKQAGLEMDDSSHVVTLGLTGQSRRREGWFGRRVWQVEERRKLQAIDNILSSHVFTIWRDAKPGELKDLHLQVEPYLPRYIEWLLRLKQ